MAIGEIDQDGGRAHVGNALASGQSRQGHVLGSRDSQGDHRSSAYGYLRAIARFSKSIRITNPENIRVVATSAVREARNRLAFIDRVYIATGMEVEPIDEAEVNRVTYLGVQPHLQRRVICGSAARSSRRWGEGARSCCWSATATCCSPTRSVWAHCDCASRSKAITLRRKKCGGSWRIRFSGWWTKSGNASPATVRST